jgi:ABC-type polysaccharide/polyol phosphate transport system ATPase subunit
MARVVLENVRVDFPIYGAQRNLRKVLFDRATGGLIQRQGKNQDHVVVKALAGVSMTLEDGDRIGLIGHNGSGKSTLLKVLAGIYEPIEGRLLVEGRVTPLFDMMPGLDVEDSGYENIITCGLLLGLSRDEIESKIPDVEEFSELGEYLALPVRTYSSGMTMRLGFALVTALDPGVLLMDEGIGAGDARFAERAEKRLNDFVGRSRIVVVASHAPGLIKSICNKAALLQAGRIVAMGAVDDVFEQYDIILHGPRNPPAAPAQSPIVEEGPPPIVEEEPPPIVEEEPPPIAAELDVVPAASVEEPEWLLPEFAGDGSLRNEFAECLGGTVETLGGALCGQPEIQVPFTVCIRYRLLKDCPFKVVPSIHVFDPEKRHVLISTPSLLPPSDRGTYVACCRIDPFTLNNGRYSVVLGLGSIELEQPVHFYVDALRFEVTEPRGADPRRHGYEGEFPGTTRARLDWRYAKLDDDREPQSSIVPANDPAREQTQ